MKEVLYYPCIVDGSGHIRVQLTRNPMTKDEASTYLKTHYWREWLACDAIPQPETMQGLIPGYK